MPRYLQTILGQRAHLGRPHYDDDSETWANPDITLCGLASDTWSKAFTRPRSWATKKPGTVCDACDRTALWESVAQLGDR